MQHGISKERDSVLRSIEDPVATADPPHSAYSTGSIYPYTYPDLSARTVTMVEKAMNEAQAHSKHDQGGHTEQKESPYQPDAIAATLDAAGQVPDPWGRTLIDNPIGYDGSLMGSINVLPEYQEYYGLGEGGSATTGLVFSIFQVGQMAGALFIWICDWRGRKMTLAVSSFFVCGSAVFTAMAPTLSSFIGARFLLSFFSTINTVAAPMLLVEIAPPLHRATVAGIFNTLWYMGSIIATFTMYGANIHLSGNIKWRLPLWLQILCPGIVALGSWSLPESPRWQVAQGRVDEARAFIIKHHANGDASHPIVAIEMQEIEDSLIETRGRSQWACFDLRSLYKSRARLYRVMLVVAMAWFGQFSGNNVSSYYLPKMVENVGITSTNMVLLLNAIYAVTGWIAATFGAIKTARLHDIIGRRKMLMGSCLGMSVALAIVAATAAEYERSGSVPSSSASIAFIFIFGVVFAVAFTPMQPIYPAEVLANDMRANGMMVFQITAGCASFVNTFAAPTAMENIRYWFYVFFVFWDLFEFAFIYFFFVETKGRTLEELDAVFDARNPRKESTRRVIP
ncbi:Lactose permease [Fusarium albosuccineum]|uniref:Lactose permease n=1 Tax=Fusarium albosuccineum TaxID=1237068 RepID=A0A8H4PAU8_9HYPO|nr:Lactose permease [Fusarium albosuccineum]